MSLYPEMNILDESIIQCLNKCDPENDVERFDFVDFVHWHSFFYYYFVITFLSFVFDQTKLKYCSNYSLISFPQ